MGAGVGGGVIVVAGMGATKGVMLCGATGGAAEFLRGNRLGDAFGGEWFLAAC